MNGFSIEESKCIYGAKIKVTGVSGGWRSKRIHERNDGSRTHRSDIE